MQVHRSLPDAPIASGCALTVGTFDGVHRGHLALVEQLKQHADRHGVPSVAMTFVDMPICHFRPDLCPQLLTLAKEKEQAFGSTGLDHLVIVPFNEEMARQTAREFMSYWRRVAGVRAFVGGPDSALGRNREGDIASLTVIGAEMGFEVHALADKLLQGGEPISSTRTRGMVEAGDVIAAAQCLGRPYKVSGRVVPGQQLGRKIGVPTINVTAHPRKCVPGNGVYAVRVQLEPGGPWLPAAMNLGLRPTVDGSHHVMEFHVLGQDIALAPQAVEIQFVHRLRSERKFNGLEALKQQLQLDLREAEQVLAKNP